MVSPTPLIKKPIKESKTTPIKGTKTVKSVGLSSEHYHWLALTAKAKGISQAELVNRIIGQHIHRKSQD